MGLTVRVESAVERLAELAPAWQALAHQALEPNPFYEPWFLLPAMRNLDALRGASVLVVEDGRRLVGICPVRIERVGFAPFRRARMLGHPSEVRHAPLLDGQNARAILAVIVDFLSTARAPILELEEQRADGAFGAVVEGLAAERGLSLVCWERGERRAFAPEANGGEFPQLERVTNALAKSPEVQLPELWPSANSYEVSLGPRLDAAEAIHGFLTMARSGWIGKSATKFGGSAAERTFISETVLGGVRAGRVWAQSLVLDERPIATSLNFVAGDTSYCWKIAYDENFAKSSPGALLALLTLARAQQRPEIARLETCVEPDHPMVEGLWSGRQLVENRWLATSRLSNPLVELMPIGRTAARAALRMGARIHRELFPNRYWLASGAGSRRVSSGALAFETDDRDVTAPVTPASGPRAVG